MPKEYAIWTQYKDLDGIERAETGDELQARAIAFWNICYIVVNKVIML